jgi:acyl carrier protein
LEKNEFLLLLDELLELNPGTVRGPEALDSIEGWDSLAVISFMALVDEHFGISLQPRHIAGCSTIGDLVGLLGNRISVEIHTGSASGSVDGR